MIDHWGMRRMGVMGVMGDEGNEVDGSDEDGGLTMGWKGWVAGQLYTFHFQLSINQSNAKESIPEENVPFDLALWTAGSLTFLA